MTRPRVVALIALNAVLLIVFFVGLFGLRSVSEDRSLTRTDLGVADRVTIDADSVVSIARSEAGWDLLVADGRYPARYDRVEPFIEEIESGRVIREVTEDPALHEEFGVTEALARRVVIDAAAGTVDLLFGSLGDQTDAVYVRESGESTVMLAQAAVDFYLGQPASFWAYLRVFPEDVVAAGIVRVRLMLKGLGAPLSANPGYTDLELLRDAREQWLLTADSNTVGASRVEVTRFARDLADLVGDGFYEGPVAGLTPVVSVAFTVSDGREFSVEVLTDGEIVIVNPEGQGLPGAPYGGLRYTISAEKLGRLIPRATTFLE